MTSPDARCTACAPVVIAPISMTSDARCSVCTMSSDSAKVKGQLLTTPVSSSTDSQCTRPSNDNDLWSSFPDICTKPTAPFTWTLLLHALCVQSRLLTQLSPSFTQQLGPIFTFLGVAKLPSAPPLNGFPYLDLQLTELLVDLRRRQCPDTRWRYAPISCIWSKRESCCSPVIDGLCPDTYSNVLEMGNNCVPAKMR